MGKCRYSLGLVMPGLRRIREVILYGCISLPTQWDKDIKNKSKPHQDYTKNIPKPHKDQTKTDQSYNKTKTRLRTD